MRYIFMMVVIVSFLYPKILIVNSYSKRDQCGEPQLFGFLETLYKNGYKRDDFDIYFLNVRTTSKKEIQEKVKSIIKSVKKYSFVVTFDDEAFKLVGIPASNKGIQLFFSGLNYPFERYKKEYHLKNNISGVKEKIFAKEILSVFDKIRPIKKIAFFYGNGIGKVLKLQTQIELKDTKFFKKIDFIHMKSIEELKKETKKVGNNPDYTIFMPFAMSLYDENANKKSFKQFKDIYLANIKKPDYSINIIFTKLGFLGFGGADFYESGKQLAKIFFKYKKDKKERIEDIKKCLFFINLKRAKEIKFKMPSWFIKKYIKDYI